MNFTIKENEHYNKIFRSPPVTPKQHVEPCFMTSTMIDYYSKTTLPPSPPSCSAASPSHTGCSRRRRHREYLFDSFSSAHSVTFRKTKRKQRNPTRSPPSTTKGSFQMPLDVFTKALSITANQECKPPATSVLKRKEKQINDCVITGTQAKEEEEEQQEIVIVRNKSSNPLALSSILLSSPPLLPPSLLPLPLPLPHSISTQPSSVAQADQVDLIKKSGTGAARSYDNLSADCDQASLFLDAEEWIPSLEVFNRRPIIRVSWKGSPLKIKAMPYFDILHPGEAAIAATLRLTPEQYLKCKWALVLAAKDANETGALFRKSEAQKVCCIDVNKTSILWNTFGRLGWLGSKWPQ